MTEPWTPIPGYAEYGVDRCGRVWSLTNWRGRGPRILQAFPDEDGYLRVRLVRGRSRVKRPVHRLVALTFHGLPRPGEEVRHLDGDKLNNCPENLAWGTRAENAADRDAHRRTARGERVGSAKLSADDVREIRFELGIGMSRGDIAAHYGIGKSQLRRIERRENWAHV